MKAVEFPEQNVVYGKDQEEYSPLPAHKSEPMGQVVTCWELTDEDLAKVIETKRVYLAVWTFEQPLQPQSMGASFDVFYKNPDPEPQHKQTFDDK